MASVEKNPDSVQPARGGRMFALVGVLLLLYAISPGPVILMAVQLPPEIQEYAFNVIDIAYMPLGFVYDKVPAVAYFYDRYFEMLNLPT